MNNLSALLLKSYHLFTFEGIPLKLHWTLLVSALFILLFSDPLTTCVILIAFLSLIPHEYGHALCAKNLGIKTRVIVLTPLGGGALLEDMPTDYKKELKITFAGPLITLLIALAFFPIAVLVPCTFTISCLIVNMGLFAFNVFLPILPMDGGRLLRAGLASRMSHYTATKITVRISQVTAVILMMVSLVYGLFMLSLTMSLLFVAAQWELDVLKTEQKKKE